MLPCDAAGIALAAELLRKGELVAAPTETVYGLFANALDRSAVERIFRAKRRPADNPLITHVAEPGQVETLAAAVPPMAKALMQAEWPGPLTLVLKRRKGAIPDIVAAGLNTFAVRMPSHPDALRLIQAAGLPLAAPSANRSGRPSPTQAQHVLEDLQGDIPLILDGGSCAVGLESTVVDVSGETPVLLRPGAVTPRRLEEILGIPVRIADGVDKPLAHGQEARSPGMLHRHYAPKAPVTLTANFDDLLDAYRAERDAGGMPVLLCPRPLQGLHCIPIGEGEEMGQRLFAALRQADAMGATRILVEAVEADGIGLAIMNRLLRAAEKG